MGGRRGMSEDGGGRKGVGGQGRRGREGGWWVNLQGDCAAHPVISTGGVACIRRTG